jgi:hypothetical protein
MSKIAKLIAAYRRHLTVPWQAGLAPIQRVMFAVYDKADELRLRANVEEFALATHEAGKRWLLIDTTDAFPQWLAGQEYRESYFEDPSALDGYLTGEIKAFTEALKEHLAERIRQEADASTVVALVGVGSLFGVARVSAIVEGIKDAVAGRLLVFFPGEYHPENHTYRLLDARDGWNYLAVPLLAKDES